MSDKRHFTVVEGKKEHGLFVGRSPSSVAKKVVSKLSKGDKVTFYLREITQGSKKKTYGPYEGQKKKLKQPIKVGDRVYKYESKVKKVEKKGAGDPTITNPYITNRSIKYSNARNVFQPQKQVVEENVFKNKQIQVNTPKPNIQWQGKNYQGMFGNNASSIQTKINAAKAQRNLNALKRNAERKAFYGESNFERKMRERREAQEYGTSNIQYKINQKRVNNATRTSVPLTETNFNRAMRLRREATGM